MLSSKLQLLRIHSKFARRDMDIYFNALYQIQMIIINVCTHTHKWIDKCISYTSCNSLTVMKFTVSWCKT